MATVRGAKTSLANVDGDPSFPTILSHPRRRATDDGIDGWRRAGVADAMSPGSMSSFFAVTGGACWIVKTLLIWANGGTSTTGGVVGLLFLAGFASLAIAVAFWAWGVTTGRAVPLRVAAVGSALGGLFLVVNLPIPVGHALIPGSWLAEEIGVLAVAILAIVAWPVMIRSRFSRPS